MNFETGRKFHQSAREMQMVKEYLNQLCLEYGLSTTEAKADRKRVPKWKQNLRNAIRAAMEQTRTREEFIEVMSAWGYGVKWEPGQKYITYTTPENIRCRDSKLFDETLLRENMECYFEMGGCEYLEERRYYDPEVTVTDVIYEIGSILDALAVGDNDRFHLETVHHSEEEIEKLLAMGHKLEHAQYMVDDEEEYEQQHGFGMTMMW